MSTETSENPGCLNALLQLFRGKPEAESASDEPLPYRLRDDFLSQTELSFYRVLQQVVADQAVILPKVRLADIFFVARHNENRSFFSRISQRHLDFLLCHPKTMLPLLGLELDDSSHQRPDRQKRDAFVDQVFAAANLPLVRIVPRRDYNTRELEAQLSPYLQPQISQSEPELAATTPLCPKCGVPMVKRTAKRGNQQGQAFYGCPNYPKCYEMLPVG
jgi:hypothetical protein